MSVVPVPLLWIWVDVNEFRNGLIYHLLKQIWDVWLLLNPIYGIFLDYCSKTQRFFLAGLTDLAAGWWALLINEHWGECESLKKNTFAFQPLFSPSPTKNPNQSLWDSLWIQVVKGPCALMHNQKCCQSSRTLAPFQNPAMGCLLDAVLVINCRLSEV